MKLLLCVSCVGTAAAASRQLLSARGSTGCGSGSKLTPGSTTKLTGKFDGVERSFRIYVPSGYTGDDAVPLVVSTHGWGGSASQDESGSGLTKVGGGFLAVFPDGYADNTHSGSWGSWNCVGSTQSPGPEGQICTSSADPDNSYCYTSCNGCAGADGCDWTTCLSDITPTGIGTSDVTGFIPQLYDYMEENFCVDLTREYHTGFSNGAMFTYQAGVSMASRLAAIAPVAGSFHVGFNQAPSTKVPVMDIHGTSDNTVPANKTTSGDGWKYTMVNKLIVPNWAKANGCSSVSAGAYTKPLGISSSVASSKSLGCVDWGCDVVSCSWSGGHAYFGGGFFGGGAENNGNLVWGFLSQYTNPTHIGKGLSEGESLPDGYELRLVNVTVSDEREAPYKTTGINIADAAEFTFGASSDGTRPHYGNPEKGGCRADEIAVTFNNGAVEGSVCAPKRRVRGADDDASTDVNSTTCTLGGMQANPLNGCPTDLPGVNAGKQSAYPQCLLANPTTPTPTYASMGQCFLTCDPCRNNGLDACDSAAHNMCPKGAACVTGALKNVKQGICLYNSDANPAKYHQGEPTDAHCFEMVYTDKAFQAAGYTKGGCDSSFSTVENTDFEIICDGDSAANVKTCPDSTIQIVIAKKGKAN